MNDPEKTYIIIFNYGGGMRGLIPAHIMSRIEDITGLRMADMADIFCGPSTGAILNAALNRPHPEFPDRPMYRARHLVKFYENDGLKIFPPDNFRSFRGILHDFNNRTLKISQLNALFRHGHYDPKNLSHSLTKLYGDTKLSDSLRSLVIPTYNIEGDQLSVAAEKDETEDTPAPTKNNFLDQGGHALWLKHISNGNGQCVRNEQKTPDVTLYDAVMSSCAAPSYFPCHHPQIDFHDGNGARSFACIDGNMFDNPCISYLGAVRRHIPQDAKVYMIILGTGYTNRAFKGDDWNKYGALGIVDPVNDLPLINIFFHASESALLESFAEEMGDDLFVFNKSMFDTENPQMPSTQIDDASPENLKALKYFAEEMMEEQKNKLDALCHILATNRDRRVDHQNNQFKGRLNKVYYKFFGQRSKDKK